MKQLLEQLGFKDDKGVYLPMLSEFVLSCETLETTGGIIHTMAARFEKTDMYTNFITQPLTKGMFIPCDEDGNLLEEPIETIGGVEVYAEEYQQAMERVLFDGWQYWKTSQQEFIFQGTTLKQNQIWSDKYLWHHKTIEQAINNGVKLYLK